MNIKEYIQNISFSISDDQMRFETFESINLNDNDIKVTTVPLRNEEVKSLVMKIAQNVPRMSTFAIGAIINHATSLMPAECAYVNIGTWAGYSLFCGMAGNDDKRCIGVDNFSEFTTWNPRDIFYAYFNGTENHQFYEMDYQVYLKNIHKGEIGVYFYDGYHGEDDQFLGLACAEEFFSDKCIIIVDDYNGLCVQKGTERFIEQSSFRYETLFKKFTKSGNHPTYWAGIHVFQKGKRK